MTDDLGPALAELQAARDAYDAAKRFTWFPPGEVSARLVTAQAGVAAASGGERALVLTDLPPCSAGAPNPIILADGLSVWLSYVRAGDRSGQSRVVVRFSGAEVSFGGPNDESLHGHRLWGRGLAQYSFHEVIASGWVAARERENSVHDRHSSVRFARLRHFVFTFHDETFECLADGFTLERTGIDSILAQLNEPTST